MRKFTARTRLKWGIRCYLAEWWVHGNGYATAMFQEGPHQGKAYLGTEVRIALGERWKLEDE